MSGRRKNNSGRSSASSFPEAEKVTAVPRGSDLSAQPMIRIHPDGLLGTDCSAVFCYRKAEFPQPAPLDEDQRHRSTDRGSLPLCPDAHRLRPVSPGGRPRTSGSTRSSDATAHAQGSARGAVWCLDPHARSISVDCSAWGWPVTPLRLHARIGI